MTAADVAKRFADIFIPGIANRRHRRVGRRLRAPSSRRRPPSPSRWSSGTRHWRDRNRRLPGRRPSPARAGGAPRWRRSLPAGRSAWMAERKVPGHTQLTRIPSRAYSTAATFASWMTAAFVAQYGAGMGPRGEAGDRGGQHDRAGPLRAHTGTAARIPLTAPRTLTRNARSQSSVARLWMRPLGARTPALLISTSSRPKQLDGEVDHRLDLSEVAHVGQHRLDPRPALGKPANRRLQRRRADVAQHQIGARLAGQPARQRRSEGSPRACDGNDSSGRRHRSLPSAERLSPRSYEQVPTVDVEHRPGHERRSIGGQELVGAGQVGGAAPASAARCARGPRPKASGLFFHFSARGESNHPGATTFTVMPEGARSRASPLAMPTSPAFEALYAVSPSRGRSPSTEPVKISRPPWPMTRAAARAPRNAPVRFTSRTSRHTDGSVLSGPARIGRDPGVADPDVDAAPFEPPWRRRLPR